VQQQSKLQEVGIARKRNQIDPKTKQINWLIGKKTSYIYRKQITHLKGGN
jgi:hypothetical protein